MNNFYAIAAFIDNNKVIFFLIFIVVGGFLNFLGAKIVKATLFITALLVCCGGIFMLLFSVFGIKSVSTAVMWVIFVCAILISFAVAYLFLKFIKVFYAVLGGIMGYVCGLMLYNFLLRYIQSGPLAVYWITIVVCVILGVLFAIFAHKHLIILSTSILGSYIFIRGISFVAGGFPSEGEITDLIQRKEYDQLSELINGVVYAYMAGIAVMIAAGIFIQYKYYDEEDEKKVDSRTIGLTDTNSTN